MNWLFDRRRFMDLNFAAALFHGVHTGGFDILDILVDAGIDSLKMLPFLYAAFLFMEYFEHKAGDKLRCLAAYLNADFPLPLQIYMQER